MTRINTNVSSLVGRNNLTRSNASLSQALTRLSTGLRINTGKDDPAGLIASENLRSDITSVRKAISNTDRANQVIGTADSALGQVSSLLNDIRGLVTESANAGALSDAQIAANQSQIDSSLDALNRIAQTTTFQGRKLLDGSLDFTTLAGSNFGKLQSLQIDQANLGAAGSVPVTVNVSDAATKAQVNVTNVPSGSGTGVAASTTISINSQSAAGTAASGQVGFTVQTAAAVASTGTLNISLAEIQAAGTTTVGGQTFNLTAVSGGAAAGAAGNSFTGLAITYGNGSASATYASNTLTVNLTQASGAATISDLISTVNSQAGTIFTAAAGSAVTSTTITATASSAGSLSGGRNASTEAIAITGATAGTSGNIGITLTEGGTAGTATAVSGGYSIAIGTNATVSAIAGYINALTEVNATTSSSATYNNTADAPPSTLSLTNGAAATTAARSLQIVSKSDNTGSNLNLTFTQGSSNSVTGSAGTYTITYASGSTLQNILSQVETIAQVDTAATDLVTSGSGSLAVTASPSGTNSITGYTAPVFGNDVITITNEAVGTAGNGKTVTVQESVTTSQFDSITGVGATVDSNGNINVYLDASRNNIDIDDIANVIDGLQTSGGAIKYAASVTSAAGSGVYNSTTQTAPTVANTASGAAAGGLAVAAVFELAGINGSEVLSFGAGTSLSQLVDGINLVKDATGVEAVAAGTTLQLKSSDYGSTALVDLKVISEGPTSTPTGIFSSVTTKRDLGTDIVATVNGVVANGKGNQIEINTSTLDFKASIEADFEGVASFTINGGGALFQLGPDVVSNQQARLGITSVNTARLGGVAGKLYQLANGSSASLANDPTAAARIVEEAIDQVTSLRGRLGAFQRTTLETNKNALGDTLVNLQDAESAIRDADFAEETANLTRAQILVQSGTRVLAIANQNPQNVLALLQ